MMVVAKNILSAMCLFAVLLSCRTSPAKQGKENSQNPAAESEKKQSQGDSVVLPEIVRSKNMHIANGLKTVTVGNVNGEYLLACNVEASSGCVTPIPAKIICCSIKIPASKCPELRISSLWLVQDWTVSYKEGENIGLVPEEPDGAGPAGFGMYTLDSWSSSR